MKNLTDILNWRRVSETLTLSGQPTEAQLADIAGLGATHIINLGPHDNDGALPDEAGTVAALGMTYVYIPVDFEAPTDADYEAFAAALETCAQTTVHVHCIYNARVTAFMYRHAKAGKGLSEADAFAVMDGIWRPGADWAAFIDSPEAEDLPNRFAGYDY